MGKVGTRRGLSHRPLPPLLLIAPSTRAQAHVRAWARARARAQVRERTRRRGREWGRLRILACIQERERVRTPSRLSWGAMEGASPARFGGEKV